MNHTLKQRSALAEAAERALAREPDANLGDRLIGAVGFTGMFVILVMLLFKLAEAFS